MGTKVREPKDRKDRSWIMDTLLFIPELILIPIRLIVRGIVSLFKWMY